jgi:hypothetical protein
VFVGAIIGDNAVEDKNKAALRVGCGRARAGRLLICRLADKPFVADGFK